MAASAEARNTAEVVLPPIHIGRQKRESNVSLPTGGPAHAPFSEAEEKALEHAWNWFALHSGQRMHLISLYFVVLALLVAGYGAALQADSDTVAAGLCVTGLVMTPAFWLIDTRTKSLVKAAEMPLAVLESRLAGLTNLGSLELVKLVETARPRMSSYSRVVAVLMSASIVLMVSGVVYATAAPDNDSHDHGQHHGRSDDRPR